MKAGKNINLRRATLEDAPSLIELRLAFLEELDAYSSHTGDIPQEEVKASLKADLEEYVPNAINIGQLVAWLAEDIDKRIVATGWLCYTQKVPHVTNPAGLEGYILNVHTSESFRRMGIASAIIKELINEAKQSRAKIVKLIASDAGKPVYTKLGFVPDEGCMKLSI